MKTLSSQGRTFADELAKKHDLSRDTVVAIIAALQRGHGSMAQFSCAELGSVQWMKGGMTMVSDMFNDRLKARVNDICSEVSARIECECFEALIPKRDTHTIPASTA
jgi:hypothetical protein